ncbi:1,2-phenylacetyl-CoA epoxidase, subunit C [Labrenzia sp. THAF82]|uniref:1,2-phenylacetyl-CoA epoxidase subunit PaaC n=1 Tax=Labrenzia sp. THAF82 TaxID=2587861 RepID=UPI001268F209|nr:1,2-phenylacetyl-CoA epoxidase subunit PaaC [Labrenzia sp. THAF82]QFT32253.1 1,2-phenylacetyl-CoA epoxidase, subunit C [Labrenzia sp. THAF82]
MTDTGDNIANDIFFDWLLRRGDTALVLGHRVSEWCGHSPVLEEDIALANIALDLIGQARLWLSLAGEVEGKGRGENELAYLRDAWDFRNLLLAEKPNGDFGQTVMRQFLIDAYQAQLLKALAKSADERVAEIAVKAGKEVDYHLDRSADLVIRLGDGTAESRQRMQMAVETLWPYSGEMFIGDAVDQAVAAAKVAPSPEDLRPEWVSTVDAVFTAATLSKPETDFAHTGGLTGRHSEHLGHILADMQFLQRAYPGATW